MNRILLINYQAHKRSVIDLAPTITSIIGRSNHGKTTVIRAVEFVRDNKPSGTNFIRKGTNTAKVSIDAVTHIRTLTGNEYKIEGHKDPFKALRKGGVPEQVTNTLNLSEDNVQEQQGKIFLLQDSPGKVAEKLSSLIDVEDAKDALEHVRGQRAALKDTYNSTKKSLESAEKAVEALTPFIGIDAELVLIEQKRAKVLELQVKANQLARAIQKVEKWSNLLSQLPDTAALEPAKKIIQEYKEIKILIQKRDALKRIVTKAENNEWWEHAAADVKKLGPQVRDIKNLVLRLSLMVDVIGKCIQWGDEYTKAITRRSDLQFKKDEIMGETCPLCGKSQL